MTLKNFIVSAFWSATVFSVVDASDLQCNFPAIHNNIWIPLNYLFPQGDCVFRFGIPEGGNKMTCTALISGEYDDDEVTIDYWYTTNKVPTRISTKYFSACETLYLAEGEYTEFECGESEGVSEIPSGACLTDMTLLNHILTLLPEKPPTEAPVRAPDTSRPTGTPTGTPTEFPTNLPTTFYMPTSRPTGAPSDAPTVDPCSNAIDPFPLPDGSQGKCSEIANVGQKRKAMCTDIYKENCPGLCGFLDGTCGCHDYELEFVARYNSRQTVECNTVSVDQCDKKRVKKNCPTVCDTDTCGR